ncbi:hypothetical protein Rhe02_44110 [Rhizocola hellebori]|uniref:YcxB-like C-terminal domain-containing protein n=1 Tax=Rhizocola hellebori TaxID=1392758 RepID=A0A8J3Q953_9ACTN|nr:hypothetical protein Rhe02_44110 [Rhizocola hellebori]
MEVSVRQTIDRAYVARAVKATLGWKYWMFRLGGPLIVVLSVFPSLSAGDLIPVVFGVLAFFIPEIMMWGTMRQAKGDPETRLRLTDQGLSADVSGASATYEWKAFRTARETRDFWLLRRHGGVSIPVPKAPVSSEQADQIRAVLRENGLLR